MNGNKGIDTLHQSPGYFTSTRYPPSNSGTASSKVHRDSSRANPAPGFQDSGRISTLRALPCIAALLKDKEAQSPVCEPRPVIQDLARFCNSIPEWCHLSRCAPLRDSYVDISVRVTTGQLAMPSRQRLVLSLLIHLLERASEESSRTPGDMQARMEHHEPSRKCTF